MTMLSLKIINSGSAFEGLPRQELARILRQIADQIECHDMVRAYDVDGNKCGDVHLDLEQIGELENV